jgi:hypothetical protein
VVSGWPVEAEEARLFVVCESFIRSQGGALSEGGVVVLGSHGRVPIPTSSLLKEQLNRLGQLPGVERAVPVGHCQRRVSIAIQP